MVTFQVFSFWFYTHIPMYLLWQEIFLEIIFQKSLHYCHHTALNVLNWYKITLLRRYFDLKIWYNHIGIKSDGYGGCSNICICFLPIDCFTKKCCVWRHNVMLENTLIWPKIWYSLINALLKTLQNFKVECLVDNLFQRNRRSAWL